MVADPEKDAASVAQPDVTVLVIDDDADLRGYIRDCLRRHGGSGTTVLEAATAQEALELLEATVPDLVITDVVMPGMDGFAFTRQVRLTHASADLPVLLVTGELSRRDASSRATAVGAQATLAKPFNARELCAAVAQLLGARGPP